MTAGGAAPDLDALTACFARKVGAWFAEQASFPGPTPTVEELTFRRQTNMTLALAASKWGEFRALREDEAVPTMRAWLDDVEARAEVRGAQARAQAIREARAWFEACAARER